MPGPGKKYEKGQSGNPGGRPKIPDEFKEKCREFSSTVFEKWKTEVTNGGENWMKAAELIVAYGHGRPAQGVEVTGKDGAPLSFKIDMGGE